MEGFLDSAELADRLGIQRTSVHRYVTRGDLPPADEKAGRTPLWRVETIDAWLRDRPGHGWRKGRRQATD